MNKFRPVFILLVRDYYNEHNNRELDELIEIVHFHGRAKTPSQTAQMMYSRMASCIRR